MDTPNQEEILKLLQSAKELEELKRKHNPDRDQAYTRIQEAERRFNSAKSIKQKYEVIDKIYNETIKDLNPNTKKILENLAG